MDNFKNNNAKISALWDKWYPATSDKAFIGRTNLDLNEIVEMASLGTIPNYIEAIQEKQTDRISNVEITLEANQECLQAVFWYNTGSFDTSNYQAGIIDNSYREDLKRDIQKFDKTEGKIAVFMTGNLIGKEWGLKNLINSALKVCTEKSNELSQGESKVLTILFYGLKKRIDKLTKDIKFCLYNGADEVYLMKGEEEFEVLKKLGIDVLDDICKNLHDSRVKYIREGTETRVNLIKKNKGKSNTYNLIKFRTNNSSKSENVAIMEKPRENMFETKPDATFICGGNYTASIKNENIFFPAGQLNFMNARKGANPKFMCNDGNIFKICPEGNHCLSICSGGQEMFDNNAQLINEAYKTKKLNKAIGESIKSLIDEKIAKIMSEKVSVIKTPKRNDKTMGDDNGK